MTASYATLAVDTACEGVLRIALNRPERRNAINVQMMLDLDAALHDAEHNRDIRAILLCANGDAFSAGHELDRTGPLDAEWEAKRATSEGRYFVEEELYYKKGIYLRDYPKPTIAIVQGPAVAAGWTLASLCDLVVASPKARFQNPMCRMATSGPFILVEAWDLNVRKAKELLFTGDWLSAEEGLRYGLVNQIYAHDQLMEGAVALARRIAGMPPWALRLIKRSLNHVLDEMGQRNVWEHQFVVRQLGHASEERAALQARLKQGNTVKSFLEARDQNVDDGLRSAED